jgi:hypothetical protein
MQITTDELSYLPFYQIEAQMKLALHVDITEKSGRLVTSNQVPGNAQPLQLEIDWILAAMCKPSS